VQGETWGVGVTFSAEIDVGMHFLVFGGQGPEFNS
jgi:hypothetical protein